MFPGLCASLEVCAFTHSFPCVRNAPCVREGGGTCFSATLQKVRQQETVRETGDEQGGDRQMCEGERET